MADTKSSKVMSSNWRLSIGILVLSHDSYNGACNIIVEDRYGLNSMHFSIEAKGRKQRNEERCQELQFVYGYFKICVHIHHLLRQIQVLGALDMIAHLR